jgi:hypothetical protein
MANLPQEQRDKLFSRIDSDGNGKITPDEVRRMRQEAEEMHKRQMRELDADNSGGLSYEEMSKGKLFSQLPEEKRMQIFKRMDTNGDGQITPEDQPKGPRPHPEGRPEGLRKTRGSTPASRRKAGTKTRKKACIRRSAECV